VTDSHPFDDGRGAQPAASAPAGVSDLVSELRYVIESARPLPLSASSTINKDDVLAMIDEIQATLPDELRSARWLLKEREEFRAKMRREGDEIVALARNRAEQMVQRTQVVKAAEARARKVVEAAEAEARQLRLEAEDYCDQKLGSFENVLQRTLQQVGAGRAKLQGNLLDELGSQEEQVHPLDEPSPMGDPMQRAPQPEAQGY
jgi:regulator of protease activity HflC (stomatin/prohibitin superfamily)